MAKAKQVRKHSELITPTTTSRVLTWLLLIILPIIAFYLGLRYQEYQDSFKMFDLHDSLNVQQQMMPASPSANPGMAQ
jgi:hypothetical protein